MFHAVNACSATHDTATAGRNSHSKPLVFRVAALKDARHIQNFRSMETDERRRAGPLFVSHAAPAVRLVPNGGRNGLHSFRMN